MFKEPGEEDLVETAGPSVDDVLDEQLGEAAVDSVDDEEMVDEDDPQAVDALLEVGWCCLTIRLIREISRQ